MVGMVMRPCTRKIGERLLGTNPDDDLGSGQSELCRLNSFTAGGERDQYKMMRKNLKDD